MKANDTKPEIKGKRTNTATVTNAVKAAEVDIKTDTKAKKETEPAPIKETPKASTKTNAKPAPKETAKAAVKETAKVAAKVAAKETAKVAPKAAVKETAKAAPKETAKPAPKETAKAAPKETAKATPKVAPKEKKEAEVATAKANTKKSTVLVKADTNTGIATVKTKTTKTVQKAEKMNAVKTEEASYLIASENAAYNFGTGDFTVEAWVKTKQPGTIIARKGDAPGPNNGGFLLVIKDDSSIKLATDDGTGFYEVVSNPEDVLDDKWHHVLGVRQDGKLDIYLDFIKLGKTVQTNHFTPLDVSNSNNLTIAFTEQQGEVHQDLVGQLTDVRIWNIAKIYGSKEKYNALKLKGSEKGLVGWWNFSKKDGSDFSRTKNGLEATGTIEYVEKK